MDVISATWFSEMEMEDYSSLDAFEFASDQDLHHQGLIEESLKKCLSTTAFAAKPNSSSSARILCFDNSSKLHDNNNSDETNHQTCTVMKPKKEAVDLKFSSHIDHHHEFARNTAMKESNTSNNKNKKGYSSIARSPFYAQDHIMAERKRREKLGQRFIALSAIIPGLKKTDKASVLGEAIKYLKELQERADTLEKKCKQRVIESVVLVRKSQLQLSLDDHDISLSNGASDIINNHDLYEEAHILPEIEARIFDEEVLVRIQCGRRKGITTKIQSEIEKIHLCIVHSNIVPFGSSTLNITILSKMESQFSMSMRDLVKTLRLALLNII